MQTVVVPKTALNASAWAPVLLGAAEAAVFALAHVLLAISSAPQVLVNVSQINSSYNIRFQRYIFER